MKVRMDFVTNSSSSSFILAYNSKMNEKQKQALIEYVESTCLGVPMLTPESTEEEIQKLFESKWEFQDEEIQKNIREALKSGKSIYGGLIDFEDCSYHYGSIFEEIWELLKEHGDGNFIAIDDDLSY